MQRRSFLSALTNAALCVVCAAWAAAPAAAMIVTAAPLPPPAGELILAQDTPLDAGSYLCAHGTGTAVEVGQTFRLMQPATLDKITLRVRPDTDVRGELVTLFFGTFTDPDDATMNELLAAEVRGLPQSLVVGETVYLTFDIENRVLLPGRQYGFRLGFTGGGNVNLSRLDLLHMGEDAYAGGLALAKEGALTTALPADLAFFLHGVAQVDGDALLLQGGRFRVQAAWQTLAGSTGVGAPVALTGDSGYFWFFAEDNVELVVKVLDACVEPFDRFWVFAAGLTNVEVTLTVTDTVGEWQEVYTNPLGTAFQPLMDTDSFATCGGGS